MDAAIVVARFFDEIVEEFKREYESSPKKFEHGLTFPLTLIPPDLSESQMAIVASAGESTAGTLVGIALDEIRDGRKDLEFRLGLPRLFAAIHSTMAGRPDNAKGLVEVSMKKPLPDGTVEIVLRVLTIPKFEVPPNGSLVFLDATAHLQPHEYNAACRQNLEHFRLTVEPHPGSRVHRLMLGHNGASRAKSCDGSDGATDDGRKMLLNTLCAFASEAKRLLPGDVRLAVITHKPLAEELTNRWFGRRLLADLSRHGVKVAHVGYYGADERATNSMLDCNAVMVIGDPIPNIGSMGTLAEAVELFTGYSVDRQALINGVMAATVSQALGRLRADSRSGEFILCCVSNTFPEGWDSDNTCVVNLSAGGGLPPLKRLGSPWPELEAEIERVLTEYDVCSPKLVSLWLQCQAEVAGSEAAQKRFRQLGEFFDCTPARTRQRHFRNACQGRATKHSCGAGLGVVWANTAIEEPDRARLLTEHALLDLEAKAAHAIVRGDVAV
jgi:hypothetical protein